MQKYSKLQFKNFTDGVWRNIQNSLAPDSSYKLGVNLDSDKKIGSLVSRRGLAIFSAQLSEGQSFFGIHNHIEYDDSKNKIFAVTGDGQIFDVEAGTVSLTGDTAGHITRFVTYLGSTIRFNGADALRAYKDGVWELSGGAFDLDNMPNILLGIEWKDRFYGVDSVNPDTLLYSSLADPETKEVSWTEGNGSIVMEQEDGGGGITALVKIPGYLLVFKKYTMKRWNGTGTYPEDLITQGTPSQEAVCMGRGMAMFINSSGIWATNGSYPQRISRPIQDIIEAIPKAQLAKVTSCCNNMYAQWSIGNIKIDDVEFQNVVLKFNMDDNSWNIRSYREVVEFPTNCVSEGEEIIICGNNNGEIFKIDKGYLDNGKSIPFSLDFQSVDFGVKGKTKTINNITVLLSGSMNADFLIRKDSTEGEDFENIANIQDKITNIGNIKLRGNSFDMKIVGMADSAEGVIIDGIELDKSGSQLNETKQ